ncbi:tail protein [Ralstonia phage RS-PII-1]|uniref:Tail fibers protein n=1 Tax=Ralstonia phage RS-PII-1 TaxID=1932892 RepID=A0A1L7DQI2_9CAUD|nr:tail protein [Ralstonia phage RS-PII-1]APU00303.1 tail fibers protein [Ralstonia phage RS-PII-1]
MASRLTTLDVVNACLATMGESPLNALDADHPYVQSALNAMSEASMTELSRGWWFNIDTVMLKPDAEHGFVYLPDDVLNVDTPASQLVQRGRRLYDSVNSTYDMTLALSAMQAAVIPAIVTRDVPFDDLPILAQHLISARTALQFQASYDGDSKRYQELGQHYQQMYNTIKAHDIRNRRVNMLTSPGVAEKLNRIRPLSTWTATSWRRNRV